MGSAWSPRHRNLLGVLRGLAARGNSAGCSRDSGSNFSTGFLHQGKTDLDADSGEDSTPTSALFHPAGTGQPMWNFSPLTCVMPASVAQRTRVTMYDSLPGRTSDLCPLGKADAQSFPVYVLERCFFLLVCYGAPSKQANAAAP